jgi:hypothetical protein
MLSVKSELPSRRKLLVATAIAVAIALLVVVLFVMPAEYGRDPTGFGKLTGISNLYSQPADPDQFQPVNTTGEQLSVFNVSWVSREAANGEFEGELAPGESSDVPFKVSDTNVTRITAVLSWSDEPVAGQQTRPDLFELNLTGPQGETRTYLGRNEGPSGSLIAVYIVDGFPSSATITAKDHEAALDAAHSLERPRMAGTGDWNAEVRLVEAGGIAPFDVGDPGNAWSLRLFVQTFYPALGDPQLTPIREDELKLTIPARGQLEFKARMNETASFTYDWTAASELNYEFHGDAQGAQGDRFESYERGTAASKSGEFKAPFTGRHGWYWQNTRVVDIEVTLKLKGDYVIVGIV